MWLASPHYHISHEDNYIDDDEDRKIDDIDDQLIDGRKNGDNRLMDRWLTDIERSSWICFSGQRVDSDYKVTIAWSLCPVHLLPQN